jgi:hypothetical protein
VEGLFSSVLTRLLVLLVLAGNYLGRSFTGADTAQQQP